MISKIWSFFKFCLFPGNLLEDSGECCYFIIPGNVDEDSGE